MLCRKDHGTLTQTSKDCWCDVEKKSKQKPKDIPWADRYQTREFGVYYVAKKLQSWHASWKCTTQQVRVSSTCWHIMYALEPFAYFLGRFLPSGPLLLPTFLTSWVLDSRTPACSSVHALSWVNGSRLIPTQPALLLGSWNPGPLQVGSCRESREPSWNPGWPNQIPTK